MLSPGDRLDRYELLCVLAQGGMGTVWLSRLVGKHGFERLVALKTILPTYGTDRTFVDMFLDEAKIAGQIDHENVVRTLEIGEDRETLYHAMELIDGESVRKLYRDVRTAGAAFPLGVALRIAADTCAGLHAVHELRMEGRLLDVVHRDVSPQNVLLTVRGTVKLIDFGVAKANERRTEETVAGTLKGKIEYMAPEQAGGTKVDRRADVYAVGAVLYELLAGEPVRNTEDGRQLLALHELMSGAPYEPLHAGVPLPIRTLVDRALASDPEDRYRTAEDMRRAIEAAMASIGLIATSDDVAAALVQYSRERTQRRKDAIDAAVKVAQQLEKDRGNSAPAAPATNPSLASFQKPAASSRPGVNPAFAQTRQAETNGTIVKALAAPPAMSSGSVLLASGSAPVMAITPSGAVMGHPLEGQMVLGPNGPQLFQAAALSSGQLPSDGPVTGPSMRTMQGASISQGPGFTIQDRKSPTRVIVLGFVGVLGVVAGVLLSKQSGRARAADAPAAPVTFVAASTAPLPPPTQTALPPPTLAPIPLPTPSASAADKDDRPDKPIKKPKPKKPKGGGDEYGF